ncbi:MAG TPA: ankyrin repeat domain-containing protein [Bryobacteraceae bacterium]|nr:ankyrin repeat domain-containing protein [Bryobacteraceae bacterium]HUO32734.1 ankyrin repeat domain-containing protein [Bryobacteraceae bacterium]
MIRVAGSIIAGSIAALLCLPIAVCASASPEVADAVMHRDQAAAEKLIAQHADVNVPQADGATALHWAVFQSDQAMVELLLRAGANPKAANRDGSTPLWLACVNGDASIIAALLAAGADANETLPLGRTPLMVASRTGNVDAMKLLLDHGADVNAKESLRGTTALMWAADEGHADAIRLLVQHGADIKAVSSPAERGRGPALGKSGDPRRAVKAQVQAIKEGRSTPQLGAIPLGGDRVPITEQAKTTAQGSPVRGQTGLPPAASAGPRRRGPGEASVGAAGLDQQDDDAAFSFFRRPAPKDGGGLTALVYAARADDLDSVKALLEAGADVNQVTAYGWSPLLVATQNRYYRLGAYLLDHGADVNLANKGGWTPLYLATDNRNIEGGDYPVRKPDMDHLEFIKLLLDKGANVNARMKDSTETRTVFTNQWLDENGATAFLRASQSGDIVLMKLLLAHGADPKIETVLHVNALQVAAGIGWVEGVTYEWSPAATLEAVKMLLDLGIDPNEQAATGRTALHGAAHKGRSDVVQLLVDHGARLDIRDFGNTDNRGDAKLAGHTWLPVDYADGLVRVGVQSAIPHPETGLLIRKLMTAAGLQAPPVGRTLESVCITEACE